MRIPLRIAALAALAAPVAAQTPPGLMAVPLERFPVGETLLYDAKFGFIKVGQGFMHVVAVDTIRGAPVVHAMFRLWGSPLFYKIDDRMESWFGLEDFASRRFVQDFHEGNRHRVAAYEIHPDSGYFREEGVDSLRPTSADPLDDTAFFYLARSVPLEVGKRYSFERYFRPDRNPVILEVVGRDTLDTPAGRFPSIVVRPIIKGRGILAESQNPRLWLSDDDRRIIVQMKSTFGGIGVITLILRQITTGLPGDSASGR